ncbi:T6SS effector BTH_I2691 family protein [Arhodomonas sp. KWT2]|uniref:T6SS effector BTH_I2691 family protein n=1 Tax=Arhodomonas sp. KWT2 TaxID=3344194 RepID=UPI0035BF9023
MTAFIDPGDVVDMVDRYTAAGTRTYECPFCERVGLPILPVRYAVVDPPDGGEGLELPQPMLVHAATHFPPLEQSRYGLRLLREGYLYLFDATRERWQAWMITSDARLCEFPPLGRAPTAAENAHVTTPCNVTARNYSSLFITIPEAREAGWVYLAYSDHLWSAATLETMAANRDNLRDRCMQAFDVGRWLARQHGISATSPDDIATCVPEFAATDGGTQSQGDCFPGPGVTARAFHDAGQLRERMNWTVRDTPEFIDKGALLAIEDPIGITTALNQFRNNAAERLQAYTHSEAVFEKKATSELITGFRRIKAERAGRRADANVERIRNAPPVDLNLRAARDFEARPAAEQAALLDRMPAWQRERLARARAELAERRAQRPDNAEAYHERTVELSWADYLECYDEAARQAFEAQYEKHCKPLREAVTVRARDHAQWLSGGDFTAALMTYDTTLSGDGEAYEAAVAAAFTGTSATGEGREVLSGILDRPLHDPGSFIWRALFLNQQSLLERIEAYVSGAAQWGSQIYGPLSGLLEKTPANRTPLENLIADVVGIMASRLGAVEATHIANDRLARLWQAVGWARYRIRTALHFFPADAGQLAEVYEDSLWREEVAIQAMRGNRQGLVPQHPVEPPRNDSVRGMLWAMIPDDAHPPGPALLELDREAALRRLRARLNRTLTPDTWGGLFALGLELINAWAVITTLGDDDEDDAVSAERVSALVATGGALTSALASVARDILFKTATPGSPLFNTLTWLVGIGAAVASWIGGYWAFVEGIRAKDENEGTMAALYLSTAALSTVFGITSLWASAQTVSTSSGSTAMIGRFLISRGGWAAVSSYLGWVLLGVGVLTWSLAPDGLEKWLRRCVFGTGDAPRFEDLQAALDELEDLGYIRQRHD